MTIRSMMGVLTLASGTWAQIELLNVSDVLGPANVLGPVDQVAGVGDLNGDGHADLVFGLNLPANVTTGGVRAYSGSNGALLWQWFGPPNSHAGSAIDGRADVDGDGLPDVVVGGIGNGIQGYVAVLRGIDGVPLYGVPGGTAVGFQWGRAVATLGDVNGDGRCDFAVGAPATSGMTGGLVRVLSGLNGATLLQVLGDLSVPGFGGTVAGGGDFNGDGVPDFAVSTGSLGTPTVPTVSVHSGFDGTVLWSMSGAASLGRAMDLRGDFDSDGRHDLIIGDAGTVGLTTDLGTVHVISGATGLPIHTLHGTTSYNLGIDVAALGDLDGDGGDDFAVTASHFVNGAYIGRMYVHSGVTASLRFFVTGVAFLNVAGPAVEDGGDVNGDGTDDVLMAWTVFGGSAHRMTFFDGLNFLGSTDVLGGGCPIPGGPILNTAPLEPGIGSNLLLAVSRPPFVVGALLLGLEGPAPITLLEGCTTWIDPSTVFFASWFVGANGSSIFILPIPPLTALIGSSFVAQGLVVDVHATSWFRMTVAKRITLGT